MVILMGQGSQKIRKPKKKFRLKKILARSRKHCGTSKPITLKSEKSTLNSVILNILDWLWVFSRKNIIKENNKNNLAKKKAFGNIFLTWKS